MKKILLLNILIMSLAAATFAQRPTVKVSLDSTYVIIGMPTTIHLEATAKDGEEVKFPDIMKRGGVVAYDDSLQFLLEIGDVPKIDTVAKDNGILTLREDVCVFAFDSAALLIPPFEFLIGSDTLTTNSLALKVIVPFDSIEVDPAKFVDIKTVIAPDVVWMDYIEWILIPLGVLIIIALIIGYYIFFIKNRKKEKNLVVEEKKLPAHVIAMAALEQLSDKKLWQRGEDKMYQTELTDILRQYIADRFYINAMEMTSEEIIDNLYELSEQQKSSLQNLRQILTLADLVKFAKYKPLADENQLSFMNSKMFVEQTKFEMLNIGETEKTEDKL